MGEIAFQDRIPDNHCFGCGPGNELGLRIKSTWVDEAADGARESICSYRPAPHQAAGPRRFLNGGIIATLIDCHAVCTAVADAYLREGRAVGEGEPIWYVTASLAVDYLRPTPIAGPVELRARVDEIVGRKTALVCRLSVGGEVSAMGRVTAVRVDPRWQEDVAEG